jgi:hypothetical protein
MGWVIEIAKALGVCAVTAFVLALGFMLFPLGGTNQKAIGIDLLFRLTGFRLALVGALNVVVGLLLTRLSVFSDAGGRMHFTLR